MSGTVARKRLIKNTKRSMLLQAIFFFMLLLVAVYFFLNSSFFAIEKISVIGLKELEPQTVLDLAGINRGANSFKLDIRQIENNIELSAMVARAEVKVKLPDSLIIFVEERKPAALVSSRDGFILLDNQGYYIRLVEKISEYSLPLIEGVDIPASLAPGEKVSDPGVKEALGVVANLSPDEKMMFSEISIRPDKSIEMFTSEGIKVVVGESNDIARKIKWFQKIYQQARQDGKTIKYVDVSFKGNPVVKYGE